MNKRTKFYIGVSLVISSITATVIFIALCFKKRSALAAIAAVTVYYIKKKKEGDAE